MCTQSCVCKVFMPSWCFGGRLMKVLFFSSSWSSHLLPFYLLGDCALHRFFCPKPSLRSLFSLNFGEKCFPGAKGVVWSDSGSFQDQTKLGHKKRKKRKKKKKELRWLKVLRIYCNIFNFLKLSNVSLISYYPVSWGGGRACGLVCLCAEGVRGTSGWFVWS